MTDIPDAAVEAVNKILYCRDGGFFQEEIREALEAALPMLWMDPINPLWDVVHESESRRREAVDRSAALEAAAQAVVDDAMLIHPPSIAYLVDREAFDALRDVLKENTDG